MEKTITLNESQMNLLQEYLYSAQVLEKKHQELTEAASKSADVKEHFLKYEIACREHRRACDEVDIASRVFASSVAAVL